MASACGGMASKNKPDELGEVYQDGKLIQTPETAKKWVSLLQLWRNETGR